RRGRRRRRRGHCRSGRWPDHRWSGQMSEDIKDDEVPVTGPPANLIVGVVKAMRPRQWVKNVLVLAAPLAALGTNVHYNYVTVLGQVAIAFVVFSLAACRGTWSTTAATSRPTSNTPPSGSGRSPPAWCPSGWPTRCRWCSAWHRWPSH